MSARGPTLDDVVDALQRDGHKPRQRGTETYARCPVHGGDDFDSLSCRAGDSGAVLLTCHSKGCTYHEILEALDLSSRNGERTRAAAAGIDFGGGSRARTRPCPEPEPETRTPSRITEIYDYVDTDGVLLFQVVRLEPKSFRQRRSDGAGGWVWSVKDTERVIYHLDEVVAAVQRGEVIYNVEGEKDVETLRSWGLTATCNPGGAGKWVESFSEHLRGADVVIIPDADDVGRKHAQAVAQSLAGVGARVRVLELPSLPPKGDVSDWAAAGGTREELEELAAGAPVRGPLRAVSWGELRRANLPPKPHLIEPVLRRRDQVLVFAKAGVGKSYFCLTLAAAVVAGVEVFGWKARRGRVCYLDGEMDAGELKMRISAIAAGMGVELPDDALVVISRDYLAFVQQRLPYMTDAETRDLYLRLIPEDVDLVIYDNLSCLIGGEENDSAAMDGLIDFVLRLRGRGQTGIYVHHAGKSGDQRGSTRRVDVLDTVIRLEAPGESDDRFQVLWDKHRGFSRRECPEFALELMLEKDPNTNHVITAEWVQTGIEDEQITRLCAVFRALKEGHPDGKVPTVRELAGELNSSKTRVGVWLQRARERGLL